MKKIFFMIAFVLIGSFAFANNTNQTYVSSKHLISNFSNSTDTAEFSESLMGICYITINGYDGDGNLIFSKTIQINGISAEDCDLITKKLERAFASM